MHEGRKAQGRSKPRTRTPQKASPNPSPRKKKRKRGRPRKEVDVAYVEELAARAWSHEAIAAEVGVSHDTLERNFAGVLKKGKATRNSRLQRVMFQMAVEDKNTAVAIFLAKNWLDMKDRQEWSVPPNMLADAKNKLAELLERRSAGRSN